MSTGAEIIKESSQPGGQKFHLQILHSDGRYYTIWEERSEKDSGIFLSILENPSRTITVKARKVVPTESKASILKGAASRQYIFLAHVQNIAEKYTLTVSESLDYGKSFAPCIKEDLSGQPKELEVAIINDETLYVVYTTEDGKLDQIIIYGRWH